MRATLRLVLSLSLLLPCSLHGQRKSEALWYLTSNEESVRSFLAHADQISIVAPQTYRMDENGIVWGDVDARVMKAARERNVKVVPLIVNPGFDQPMFQKVLRTPEARQRAVRNIAALCRDNRFAGIQFDFENIHISDKDAFSAFYRETAEALHRVNCTISIAVVPRTSDFPGPTAYHKWIFEYWRGAYDYKALADAGDFLSLMTYDQHTRRTPPGPIAGVPWMRKVVEHLLALGIPAAKISLGIPSYTDIWFPTHDATNGARVSGTQISHRMAEGMLARHDAKPVWDDRQKVFFATWENDGINEFMFLENAETFRPKLDLVAEYGLRGYSVWVLGQEDPAVWELQRTLITPAR